VNGLNPEPVTNRERKKIAQEIRANLFGVLPSKTAASHTLPQDTRTALSAWVGHFEGDRAAAVATLRKNPNLLLSVPSGPVAVTQALAAFVGLFDFGGGK
jgi:hypothetical protein